MEHPVYEDKLILLLCTIIDANDPIGLMRC